MFTCVNIQSGVMATFEVTTDTDSITITWTDDDVRSLANFTIALGGVERYRARGSSPTSPYHYRMAGLAAATSHTVQIQTYTTDGAGYTPLAASYTLSMLSSNAQNCCHFLCLHLTCHSRLRLD